MNVDMVWADDRGGGGGRLGVLWRCSRCSSGRCTFWHPSYRELTRSKTANMNRETNA